MALDPSALLGRRIVLLEGALDDAKASEMVAKLLFLAQGSKCAIALLIDSSGGPLIPGLALLDAISEMPVPIVIHAERARGTAFAALVQGSPGKRSARPGASLAVDPIGSGSESQSATEALVHSISSRTRLPTDAVSAALTMGLELDLTLAGQLGCIDEAISTRDWMARLPK